MQLMVKFLFLKINLIQLFISQFFLIIETTALIEMLDDDDWKNIVYIKANYKPHEEQKKAELPLYFIPNSTISRFCS
jgi:hypothetical protein